MKGDPEIIDHLNVNLKDQITAINQYFMHARIARYWGLEGLNDNLYKASIGSMKAADGLIDRILFLEGLPNLQDIGKLLIGENVSEIIECDLRLTMSLQGRLLQTVATCETVSDYDSRLLLTPMLDTAEEHIDWLETQQWQIESMGIENYIQGQLRENAQ